MVIVPVDSKYGNLSKREQELFIADFQAHSVAAGLRGLVVPVWIDTIGRFCFMCPNNWTSFFQSINMDFVRININRNVYW